MLRVIESRGKLVIRGPNPIKGQKPIRQVAGACRGRSAKITPQMWKLARDEAAALHADLARQAIHGERRGDRSFAEIANAYLDHEKRDPRWAARIRAVGAKLGTISAREIDAARMLKLRKEMIKTPQPSPHTVRTVVINPVKAVLNFGFDPLGWCDPPRFGKAPKIERVDPKFYYPREAALIIANAAPHAQPIFTFMCGTGARCSETLALQWPHVNLKRGVARLIQKGNRERVFYLPPAVVAALSAIPGDHTIGPVFKWQSDVGTKGRVLRTGTYAKPKAGGGQLQTVWERAIARAGLDYRGGVHRMRASYATWHYVAWKDPLRLLRDGGWDKLQTVQRYLSLALTLEREEVLSFWGYAPAREKTGTESVQGELQNILTG